MRKLAPSPLTLQRQQRRRENCHSAWQRRGCWAPSQQGLEMDWQAGSNAEEVRPGAIEAGSVFATRKGTCWGSRATPPCVAPLRAHSCVDWWLGLFLGTEQVSPLLWSLPSTEVLFFYCNDRIFYFKDFKLLFSSYLSSCFCTILSRPFKDDHAFVYLWERPIHAYFQNLSACSPKLHLE